MLFSIFGGQNESRIEHETVGESSDKMNDSGEETQNHMVHRFIFNVLPLDSLQETSNQIFNEDT